MTEPITHDEFNILYQNQLDFISECKDKSWKAAHYSVLGQAAVFALSQASGWPAMTYEKVPLALSMIVVIWAASLVNHLHGRIVGRREALKHLRELRGHGEFDKTFAAVWDEIKEKQDSDVPWWNARKRWKDDPGMFLAYEAAILIPAGLAVTFILR